MSSFPNSGTSKSELFNLDILDLPDHLELVLAAKFDYVQNLLSKFQRAERIINLTQIASSSVEKYRDLNDAFLYGILTQNLQVSNESFQLLHSIMQDNWEALCNQARYFTFSKYLKMKSDAQSRLLWLIAKLVALQARGVDGLCMGLIRQIKGGNRKSDNIFLINSLLQIFVSQLTWFYQQQHLIPFVIYSFTRIVSEQGLDPALQKRLASFCASVLRDKFQECSVIGRDLVRILGDVSRIPEFEPVWSFLLSSDSSSTNPDASPLLRLLKTPTPKHFVSCRLTPDMETNLIFMLEKIKYGHHKRYQDWFTAEYLSEEICHDPYPIIVDIIRYLVVAYHPSNSVIASPSVQRWHAISWLIRLLKANFAYANAKLALFYDYLFFDPLHDSIMNVEPAILMIVKSVSKLPFISCSMLEFLYLLRRCYYPTLSPMIEKCIDRTMVEILSKRVIPSLESIFLSDQIPEEIKQKTREMFPCYLGGRSSSVKPFPLPPQPPLQSSTDLSAVYEHPTTTTSIGTSPHKTRLVDLMQQLGKDDAQFDSPCQTMALFISSIGLMDSFAFESVTDDLATFIKATLGPLTQHHRWQEALLTAVNDCSADKEAIDKAVERLALLPVPKTCFDIETLRLGTKIQSSTERSLSDEIVEARQFRPESFYQTCFRDFGARLHESDQIIDLLYLILEDCDSVGLMQLKQSLLGVSENPIISGANWNSFMQRIDETVLWDGFIQLFFWDLVGQTLRSFGDAQFIRQFISDALKRLRPFLCESQKNAELSNSFFNLAIQFVNFADFSDFYSWFALFVEELGGGCDPGVTDPVRKDDALLPILVTLWRVNSRFFLQSLVKVDDATQPRPINHRHIRHGLLALQEFVHDRIEPGPNKKSLCVCLETTLALLKGRS